MTAPWKCPLCDGDGHCLVCGGDGCDCDFCEGTGICPECEGSGVDPLDKDAPEQEI